MKRSISVIPKKKRGRPATGTDPVSAIRLSEKLTSAIDKWAAKTGAPSRSEAIRRLIEQALGIAEPARERSKKSASKAREMAGEAVDRLSDQSLPDEARKKRKHRLTKGPTEFREMRGDLPKPKR
jgi:Arc/MetJ-type ribon-helix-helix transcriptional regulator